MARNKFVYLILAGLLILVILGLVLVLTGQKELKEYSDDICKVKFNYPRNWLKSDITLPLPQEPLSQVTFDEPAQKDSPPKNSILSYICYDAKNYSFSQFIEQSPFGSQTEIINLEETKWQRVGNFIYTTQNNKLIILEMFFTKYDLKPEPGYEETFLNILKTVQF